MFGTVGTAVILYLALLPNVYLDVRYRKVSETILIIGALALALSMVLTEHWYGAAVSLFAAIILSAVFARSVVKGSTGWGDVEMVAVIALATGAASFLLILFALVLARATVPLWPRIATSTTEKAACAPMAVYFAVAATLFLAWKVVLG